MLTGHFPYEFSQDRDPINVILNDDVVPIRKRDPSLSKQIGAVIDKAISVNVKNRFATAAEMLDAFKLAL